MLLVKKKLKKKKGNVGHRCKKKLEIAERRKKVTIMYLRKMHQYEIAAQLGVTSPVISIDIKAIEKQWMEESKQLIDKHRAKALANLDYLESAAWKDTDLNLVLRIFQEKNRINGIYAAEKIEGRVIHGISLMSSIKAALLLGDKIDNGKEKEIDNVEYKRLT